MDMRAAISLTEGLFEPTPADKAATAIDDALDPEWGDVVIETLRNKEAHPQRHEWPIDGDDWVVLSHIEASKPGQGYGTMMMDVICNACDTFGCRIILDAQAFGKMTQRNLERFYRSFDFVPCPELAGLVLCPMMRLPG